MFFPPFCLAEDNEMVGIVLKREIFREEEISGFRGSLMVDAYRRRTMKSGFNFFWLSLGMRLFNLILQALRGDFSGNLLVRLIYLLE